MEPHDLKHLQLAAKACKDIMVGGAQRDATITRLREHRDGKIDGRRAVKDVFSVLKHHGLLNHIISLAARERGKEIMKDDERHFLLEVVLFHVFKDMIERQDFAPFSLAEGETIRRAFRNEDPVLDGEISSIIENATRLDLPGILKGKRVAERWSIIFSHPSWLVDKLRQLLPDARVEAILRAHQAPEAFFLTARDDDALDRVIKFLSRGNIVFQHDRTLHNVLRIANISGAKRRIIENALIDMEGTMIQDFASVAVLEALNVVKGDTVIDACAAPFQKTTGVWWRAGGNGAVLALEASPQRAVFNARRIPAGARGNINVVMADAARFGDCIRGVVPDKILLDVPCSGSGSLAANPELKARQNAGDVGFFSDLQSRILGSVLDACIVHHWVGVHVVYSTCSYYPEEGEEIIDRILNRVHLIDLHDARSHTSRLSPLPAGWKGYTCSPRVIRTFPDTNGGSKGFFIAAFTPREST